MPDILNYLAKFLAEFDPDVEQRKRRELEEKRFTDQQEQQKSQRDEQRIEQRASLFRDLPESDPLNAVNVPASFTGAPTGFKDVSEIQSLPETPSSQAPGQLDRVRQLFSRLEGTDPFVGMQESQALGGAMRGAEEGKFQRDLGFKGREITELAPVQAEAANLQEQITRPEALKTREETRKLDFRYDIEEHKQKESISDAFQRGRIQLQHALSGDSGEIPKRTAQFADNKARFMVRANQGLIQGAANKGSDPSEIVEDIVNYVLEEGRKEGIDIPLDLAQGVASEALQQFPGLAFEGKGSGKPTQAEKLEGLAKEKSNRTPDKK